MQPRRALLMIFLCVFCGAIAVAQVPQQIRGYGHIKEASVTKATAQETTLWSQWALA